MSAKDKTEKRRAKLETALRANLRRRKQKASTEPDAAGGAGYLRRDRDLKPRGAGHHSATKPVDGT